MRIALYCIDLLFRIFYSPVKSYDSKGRMVAVYWLCMPLTFLSLAASNILIGILADIGKTKVDIGFIFFVSLSIIILIFG